MTKNQRDLIASGQIVRKLWLPENLFLILGLIFGGLFSVFVPFNAGFDEEMHLVRIYDIAGLHWLPNRSSPDGTVVPIEFFSLSYQRRFIQAPANYYFSSDVINQSINRAEYAVTQTRSIYPPVGFLPQAFVARLLWLKYNQPIIPVSILLRLVGLFVYLGMGYIAIKMLPFGKWVVVFLALSPAAVYQAATINLDGFTVGVSFLFVSLVLNTAAQERVAFRSWRLWAIALVCILIGMAKPGAIVILPFLLVLPLTRFQPKKNVVVLWAAAGVSVAVTVGWTFLALEGSHLSAGGDQNIGGAVSLILANPLAFITAYIRGIFISLGGYYRDWVGAFGYWVGYVPAVIYWVYPVALAAALFTEKKSTDYPLKSRVVGIVVFVFASAVTVLLYFTANYSGGEIEGLGRQGRYFLPFAPLLFLSLVGWNQENRWIGRAARFAAPIALGAVLLLFSYALYATYYTYCGHVVYTGGSCRLPFYKNLDTENPRSLVLQPDTLVEQSFHSTCGPIEQVQLTILQGAGAETGSVRMVLVAPDGRELASQEFDLAGSQSQPDLMLTVDPPAGEANWVYTIRINYLGEPANAPALESNQGDFYSDGKLNVGGEPVDSDLVFYYSCPGFWNTK